MTVEVVVQLLSRFFEVLNEIVDVVLAVRAIETAPVERVIEAAAKSFCIALNAMNDLLYLVVGQSISSL